MRTWLNENYVSLICLLIFLAFAVVVALGQPVQAAPPAPPEVKACQLVNTAAVNDKVIITVLRCQPENGAPYLINSAGFMMPEE